MYHIKADKRSQKSATLICQGLRQCLTRKMFDRITVTDIQKASTVGRATFYRLFDSKSDVLAYECDLMFNQISDASMATLSPADILMAHITIFMQHDYLLKAIIESHQTYLLYDSQRNRIEKLFHRYIDLPQAQQDFLVAHLTHLIVGTLTTWIDHNEAETADDLFHALYSSIHLLNQSMKPITKK